MSRDQRTKGGFWLTKERKKRERERERERKKERKKKKKEKAEKEKKRKKKERKKWENSVSKFRLRPTLPAAAVVNWQLDFLTLSTNFYLIHAFV
jgi:uncharacterized protein YlxW (UPF0749 family)